MRHPRRETTGSLSVQIQEDAERERRPTVEQEHRDRLRGHGHVTPNADGSKARCGGPGLCSICSRELAGGTINVGAHELLAKLHDEEPVFVIRAQDILSPQALALYADLARKVGLPEHAQEVEARAVQFMQWQARHAKLVKSPD